MSEYVSETLSWLQNQAATKTRNLLLNVLAAGPIPKHVAIVMDGNRRYARMNSKAIQQGHKDGFVALRRVLEVCLRLNIHCVSVYAFSIENFKREADEVNALMQLAEEKLLELCGHGDLLDEYGVRLNVVGKKSLLPESVQKAIAQAEELTRCNKRAILNLCMPYTSRDEMATAVESCVNNALNTTPQDEEIVITEQDIEDQLMTSLGGSPPHVDILVRTSGVKRLSDFMLWQSCENTQLQFSSTFWPDFGLVDFIPIILDYQRKIWSKPS
ncbi:Decaprenyl diphosphate synthase-like protein [Panaeolus papilionaceus]|nr:Decaprenyl diphosphate synthase-like protein [Panaeolus papilionaceus]